MNIGGWIIALMAIGPWLLGEIRLGEQTAANLSGIGEFLGLSKNVRELLGNSGEDSFKIFTERCEHALSRLKSTTDVDPDEWRVSLPLLLQLANIALNSSSESDEHTEHDMVEF